MKKKIMYIAVSAMLIAGTSCSSVFAFNTKKAAVTAQAAASSSSTCDEEHQKTDENTLMGKVTAVSDGTLTLETIGKNHMGQPNMFKHKSDGTDDTTADTKNTDNSSEASETDTNKTTEEKTITLTDSTVYYKMSAGTTSTDGTKPEVTKANVTASDVTADSMVKVQYEKDSNGDLTAVSVTIMGSSMMNNGAKTDENMLMGKVTEISDDTLTLETMVRNHKSKTDETDSSATASDDTTTSAEQPTTEEKTVALTDSTVYYKMSAETSSTDDTKPKFTKTDATVSDVTADSMISVKYEKDSNDNLTAVSVTIMDSSMMKNKQNHSTDSTSSSEV